MAGAVFSFPVASLLVVVLFVLGVVAPWFETLMETTTLRLPFVEIGSNLSHVLQAIFDWIMRAVFKVIPHFGKYNPTSSLVNGQMVGWPLVIEVGAIMMFLKGGAAVLIGAFCYARRELARVIA
jgi:hypothetical protein